MLLFTLKFLKKINKYLLLIRMKNKHIAGKFSYTVKNEFSNPNENIALNGNETYCWKVSYTVKKKELQNLNLKSNLKSYTLVIIKRSQKFEN